jgi:hypothetical protein
VGKQRQVDNEVVVSLDSQRDGEKYGVHCLKKHGVTKCISTISE